MESNFETDDQTQALSFQSAVCQLDSSVLDYFAELIYAVGRSYN